MYPRFHAPDVAAPGDVVRLPDDEARHASRVLRLKPGDTIRVFNGRGAEFEAVIERSARDGVEVRAGRRQLTAPEAGVRLTLVQAVLKGEKMDAVVRDAVMLGVAAIQPLVTSRTEIGAAALERGRRRERWTRIAVSSAKQCGRAVVPDVLPVLTFDELAVAVADGRLFAPALFLCEPGASPQAGSITAAALPVPQAATVIVGPEGGWTPEEVARASAACRLVTLGGRTLRADAAPLVALAALLAIWREL